MLLHFDELKIYIFILIEILSNIFTATHLATYHFFKNIGAKTEIKCILFT